MSSSVNGTNNLYTHTCSRIVAGSVCKRDVVGGSRVGMFKYRCSDCTNKCSYVDKHGTTCEDSSFNNEFCTKHTNIVYSLDTFKGWKQAKEYHKTHVYCGEHHEKSCGDIDAVYHYISKKRLGNRSVEDLGEWEYEDEVWISDSMWLYCGPEYHRKLTDKEFPDNFEEIELEKAVVKKTATKQP